MDQTPLTPRDNWVFARLLAGYNFKENEFPTSLSERGDMIAHQVAAVNYKNRELLLKREITPQEHRAIMVVNSEMPIPPGGDPSKSFSIHHGDELDNMPPIQWLVPGIVMEAGLTILYGESGAGKSFIGLDYSLTLAQSKIVLYVPTEGEAGYKKRVKAWKEHHRKGVGKWHYTSGSVNVFEKDRFAEILNEIKRLKPVLVVFDTLAMAMAGGDENSSLDMGKVIDHCRKINHSSHAAVMLVHHVGKAGTSARGSSTLPGNADVMVRVSPADDLVMVECTKTKDEAPFDTFYMFMRPVGDSLVPVPVNQYVRDESVLTPNQKKLLNCLALEIHADGVPTRELEELCNLSHGMTVRTLNNLKKKNLVHKPKGSYAINPAGLKAIGVDGSDWIKNAQPMDQAGSQNTQPMDQTGSSATRESYFEDADSDPADPPDPVDPSRSRVIQTTIQKLPGFDAVPTTRNLSKLGY